MLLEEIIQQLIDSKKEGDYWDFKEKHHDKAGDLLKDITCLANTVRHSGDRYIIFGVTSGAVISGVPSQDRKTQADIINTLGNAGFAGNLYPDVYLREIKLDGKILDVLIIKDTPEKPFYLQKEYNKQGVRLNPGTIYTRVRDANTPTDQVASAFDIEQMWRERFGLDTTPLERLEAYLLDFENWEQVEENRWYYKPFPEFTVQPIEENPYEVQVGECWVRAATNPSAYVTGFVCRYHQTILRKIVAIYYDEMRYLIPNPEVKVISAKEHILFYSFCANSFDFTMLQFLSKNRGSYFLQNDRPFKCRTGSVPILVFHDENQRQRFIEYVVDNIPLLKAAKYDTLFDSLAKRNNVHSNDVQEVITLSKLETFCLDWKKTDV